MFPNSAGLTGREILTADASIGVDDSAAAGSKDYEEEMPHETTNEPESARDADADADGGADADADKLAEKADASLYLNEEEDDLSDIE